MNRKKFIESHGATCANWTWSWSFVNHKNRLVIFGVWIENVENGFEFILGSDWSESNKGRSQPGYGQALEHIRLVENEGYELKTFLMESDPNTEETKISRITLTLNKRLLEKIGNKWFAKPLPNNPKIARLCWNSQGWIKPSGVVGKSQNKNSYEYQAGYGHEEWLLDTTKLIDGYHYAFIQSIGSHRTTYVGHTFDISFYSINDKTKQRWWIGSIKNIQIISGEESSETLQIYKRNGWYDEMLDQLNLVCANTKKFQDSKPESFANLKFRPEDLNLFDEPLPFSSDDPAVPSTYYNLLNLTCSPSLENLESESFTPGHTERKRGAERSYRESSLEVDLLHNRIQTDLYGYLHDIYGHNVQTERPAGGRTSIDISVRHLLEGSYSLYEIKTSPSAKQCIREAIGQLLEYAHFHNKDLLKELVVVGPGKLSDDCNKYGAL